MDALYSWSSSVSAERPLGAMQDWSALVQLCQGPTMAGVNVTVLL